MSLLYASHHNKAIPGKFHQILIYLLKINKLPSFELGNVPALAPINPSAELNHQMLSTTLGQSQPAQQQQLHTGTENIHTHDINEQSLVLNTPSDEDPPSSNSELNDSDGTFYSLGEENLPDQSTPKSLEPPRK